MFLQFLTHMWHMGQIICISSISSIPSTIDDMYCCSNSRFFSYSSIIDISEVVRKININNFSTHLSFPMRLQKYLNPVEMTTVYDHIWMCGITDISIYLTVSSLARKALKTCITLRHELLLDFLEHCQLIILLHDTEHLFKRKQTSTLSLKKQTIRLHIMTTTQVFALFQ